MQCQYVECAGQGGFERCTVVAAFEVWCPTWVTAEEGPMHLCADHARNFMPEHNPHARNGMFYWGEKATEEYEITIPAEKRKRRVISWPDMKG